MSAVSEEVYFFTLGFVYGVYIKLLQLFFVEQPPFFIPVVVIMHVAALTVPTAAHAVISRLRTGDWGVSEYKGRP